MIRILIAAFIIATIAKPAYAYIDVALGGLILQAFIGGLFTFLVIWRNWVSKFKNFFQGNGFVSDVNPDDTETLETSPSAPKE